VSPDDDEDLSAAERRVSEYLHGLADGAATASMELSAAVVRRARWQRAVRTPLRAAGGLTAALFDGVKLVLGARRGASS
jgi:hypothetical protein